MMAVMIVTGGSRGIGAATVLAAAEAGYAVCVNYKSNADAARQLVETIKGRGGKAFAYQGDVSVPEDVAGMFRQTAETLGAPTALINNAGILEHHCRFEEMSLERLQRVFNTNVIGSMLCAQEAAKVMSTKHGGAGGVIINISSVAAKLGAPNEYVDYAASKGAIDSLTIGLAKEMAESGIRVNAVRPGVIYTDIHASGGEPDRVDRVKESVPMLRGGTAAEVAQAVVWLVSDQASYCTGTTIDVSGGR
ncbi:NAD(P)-dependent oxidoreductase [Chromatiales bacterium (ex Bugula neritina AB1)]|nr:NAD(P)-dependent oxidoreductase [Chromatiales bacterium (ex Bugula neritina AB1)]